MSSACPSLQQTDPEIEPGQLPGACEHRSVSRDGRIVCKKIVEGDDEVSPAICRACPLKTINCSHLRFSLQQTSPSPLIVRFNGRTEIWDDEPPELRFEQAACAARVMPIENPQQCQNCALRQPLHNQPEDHRQTAPRRPQRANGNGKVVAFPGRMPPSPSAGAQTAGAGFAGTELVNPAVTSSAA